MTTRARTATKRRKPAKQSHDTLPLLLTAQQAWELLGVRKTRFYELRNAGLIRAVELGPQSVRYHIDDVKACAERLRRVAAK